MGRPHLLAALVIVLSTSLLLPADKPEHYVQTAIPQAGGNDAAKSADDSAPLLIKKQ